MVTGLVITKRALGARVSLDSSASVLFERPEERGSKSTKFISDHGTTEQVGCSTIHKDDTFDK